MNPLSESILLDESGRESRKFKLKIQPKEGMKAS
jgi:hypothetical protein